VMLLPVVSLTATLPTLTPVSINGAATQPDKRKDTRSILYIINLEDLQIALASID